MLTNQKLRALGVWRGDKYKALVFVQNYPFSLNILYIQCMSRDVSVQGR